MSTVVPWPTQVPNQPQFIFGAGPDQSGQWWIQIGCRRCSDVARRPCQNPQRTGWWVMFYVREHVCRD